MRSIFYFKKNILRKLNNRQTIAVMFKVKLSDGRIRNISHLQLISKKEINDLKYYFLEFWSMRDEEYNSFSIQSVIYYYRINEPEIIKTKINRAYKNRFNKETILEIKNTFFISLIGGYMFPTTNDLSKWGNVISEDSDSTHFVILKNNSNSKYIVQISGNERRVSYFTLNKLIVKFKDTIINDSYFIRTINNNKYHFTDGVLVYRERNLYLRKIGLIKKSSTPKLDNFLTMDLETRLINSVMEVYAISVYDGKKATFYYLDDFSSSEELMISAVSSLMVRKYNGYRVYLHNLSHFDGIFLLRILSQISKNIKIIIRDNDIIDIKFSWGSYYIYFRDSLLLLPSSLKKLSKSFSVEEKGIFPYKFVSGVPLDYRGPVPAFQYFDNISKEEYDNYSSQYNNDWDLRLETEKYCTQDCRVLYLIIKKFFMEIFSMYRIHGNNYKTLSSLAFAIFKSNFMREENIPIIKGDLYNFLKEGYKGGYVDVFKPSGENLYIYDVNSLYPYIMRNYKLPVGNPTLFNGDILKIYPDILSDENKYLFLEVDVTSPTNIDKPFLIHRYNNRSIAPIGKWSGVYTHTEYLKAKELGYKMTIKKGAIFEAKNIFKEYIESLYSIKKNSEKDSPTYLISKLLMNSLYGRMAMTPYLENHAIVFEGETNYMIENFKVKNIVDLNNGKVLISYEKENIEEDSNSRLNSSISVSASITAEARLFMSQFILNPSINVYYHDTDSLVVDKPLPLEFVGKELGQFKLEHKFLEGVFISPKVYGGINNEYEYIKVKGLKNPISYVELKSLLVKNSIVNVTQEKWYKNISEGNIKTMSEIYTLIATENKRKLVYDNGKLIGTKPFLIEDSENH